MAKKYTIKNLIFGSLITILFFSPAFSQTTGPTTKKSLEMSLIGLKKSAKKIAEKNKLLFIEIEQLKQKIILVRRELLSLETRKNKIEAGAKHIDKNLDDELVEVSIVKKNIENIHEHILSLGESEAEIQNKIELSENERETLDDEIDSLKKDIFLLREKLKDTTDKLTFKNEENQKSGLSLDIKKIENEILYLDRQCKKLANKNNKKTPIINDLEIKKKTILNNNISIESQIKEIASETDYLKKEIEEMENKQKEEISVLNDEIDSYNSKKTELENVLSQARARLEEKNKTFLKKQINEKKLKQNLKSVKKENLQLKKNISTLEKLIKEKNKED